MLLRKGLFHLENELDEENERGEERQRQRQRQWQRQWQVLETGTLSRHSSGYPVHRKPVACEGSQL